MSESNRLLLHEFHKRLGAQFSESNGAEVVAHYGDITAEHRALTEAAGVIDMSFRGRICLTGGDRVRFLHGQVTNDVKRLGGGQGCYSAITNAKGKIQSDLNIFALQHELLLDFEPGLTRVITERLERFIVSDDVQVVDAAPHYGLLSVQGPKAEPVVRALELFSSIPTSPLNFVVLSDPTLGEIYLMNLAHVGSNSSRYGLFVPNSALELIAQKLLSTATSMGGTACGWDALEVARIEAGIPRFGADMDETNIASECGIGSRAISYNKGCYIGQEVLNRIHSIGHVNRELRCLNFADDLKTIPARGEKLFLADKEVGHVTSAVLSPGLNRVVALGYVHREANAVGTKLSMRNGTTASVSAIVL